MQTHVQARLITIRARQAHATVNLLYVAQRTTYTTYQRDTAGVSVPVVTMVDRLIPLGGVA